MSAEEDKDMSAGGEKDTSAGGEKGRQFRRLWRGRTPKGYNRQKKQSFRSLMKNACQQAALDFTRYNARRIYMGEIENIDPDEIRFGDKRIRRPPRRHLRGI